MSVVYLDSTVSGEGGSLTARWAGPPILAPGTDPGPPIKAAVQAAVRGAGRQSQRQAVNAYSPRPIKDHWTLATKTTPILQITVGNTEPLAGWVENPTRPHDIPGAFGYKLPFGIGGRFNGKFHPGTPGKHRLPGLLAALGGLFEGQIARRVPPLLTGTAGASEPTVGSL